MNPYKDGGPRARLSFVPAYCKRCTAPPSVNDGYIARRPPRADAPPAAHAERHARIAFDAWDFCMRQRAATAGRATAFAALPRSCRPPRAWPRYVPPPHAIAAIETLVRQCRNGAFIMRV